MLPFIYSGGGLPFTVEQYIYIPGIRAALESGADTVTAYLCDGEAAAPITLSLPGLSAGEREIILKGCLMNYYASKL
jgi:aconitate hydratase